NITSWSNTITGPSECASITCQTSERFSPPAGNNCPVDRRSNALSSVMVHFIAMCIMNRANELDRSCGVHVEHKRRAGVVMLMSSPVPRSGKVSKPVDSLLRTIFFRRKFRRHLGSQKDRLLMLCHDDHVMRRPEGVLVESILGKELSAKIMDLVKPTSKGLHAPMRKEITEPNYPPGPNKKDDDPDNAPNNRRVSLVSSFSKIYDKIALNQFTDYLM
ncbi:Hypothetical predicted protein, partial [Paramuricea clavata]